MEKYQELEQELIRWTGCRDVVVCSSGTAALHLAIEVLETKRPSTVIVPDYTMIACPRSVVMGGNAPAFIDCVSSDLLMDTDLLRYALRVLPKVSGVMVVHVYGRPVHMDEVFSITDPFKYISGKDLYVIEDLAECHGKRPHPYTDAACYSFYKNKTVHGEEGGAIGFRNPEHAKHARQLRSLGFTEDHDYTHIPRGYNYRLSNANASLILDSLTNYSQTHLLDKEMIDSLDLIPEMPLKWIQPDREYPWVYDLRIKGMSYEIQTEVVKALQEVGIQARYGFKPCSTQKEFLMSRWFSEQNAMWGTQAYQASREVIYVYLPKKESNEGANLLNNLVPTIRGVLAKYSNIDLNV